MVLSDAEKEHQIALYLAAGYLSDSQPGPVLQTLAKTTPYPELAHDLLKLVRRLDLDSGVDVESVDIPF